MAKPPTGGDCRNHPTELFVNIKTDEQATAARRICAQCPALDQCQQWVRQILREENRGRVNQGLAPRIHIDGVYAGVWYQATDARGRPTQDD